MKKLTKYLVVFVALFGLTFGLNTVNAQTANDVKQQNNNKYVIALEAFAKMNIFQTFTEQKPAEVSLTLNLVDDQDKVLKDGDKNYEPITHNGTIETNRDVEVPVVEGYELETNKDKIKGYEIVDVKDNKINIIFNEENKDIKVVYKKVKVEEENKEIANTAKADTEEVDKTKEEVKGEVEKKVEEQPTTIVPKAARLKLPDTGITDETVKTDAEGEKTTSKDLSEYFKVTDFTIYSTDKNNEKYEVTEENRVKSTPSAIIDWEFEIPNNIDVKAGDTVTIPFGKMTNATPGTVQTFVIPGENPFIAKLGDEKVEIGKYIVNSNDTSKSTVTITFNEKVEGNQSLKGDIEVPLFGWFISWFKGQLDITFGDKTKQIYYNESELVDIDGQKYSKSGTGGTNSVFWSFQFGRDGVKALGESAGSKYVESTTDVIVEDTFPGKVEKLTESNVQFVYNPFVPMSTDPTDNDYKMSSANLDGFNLNKYFTYEGAQNDNETFEQYRSRVVTKKRNYGIYFDKNASSENCTFIANVGDFLNQDKNGGWQSDDDNSKSVILDELTGGKGVGTYFSEKRGESSPFIDKVRAEKADKVFSKENAIGGGIPDFTIQIRPEYANVDGNSSVVNTAYFFDNNSADPIAKTASTVYDSPRINTVLEKRDLVIKKYDATSNFALENAEFKLERKVSDNKYEDYNNKQVIDPNVKGVYTFKNVKNGTYRITETKAPNGYDKNSFKLYSDDPNVTEEISNEFTIDGTAGVEVKVTNKKIVGNLKVTKVDKNTQTALKGAQFTVYQNIDGNNTKLGAVNALGEGFKNFVDGKFSTNENGVLELKGLVPGKYIVQEVVAPEGYDLSNEKLEVEVKATTDDKSFDEYYFENQMQNALVKFDLRSTKGTKDKPIYLPGGQFQIYKKVQQAVNNTNETTKKETIQDELVKVDAFNHKITDENGNLKETVITNVNSETHMYKVDKYQEQDTGKFEFMLPVGEYYMIQTKVPSNYKIPSTEDEKNTTRVFKVEASAKEPQHIIMYNEPVVNPNDDNKIIVPPTDGNKKTNVPNDPKLPKTGKVTKTNTPIKTKTTTLFGLPRTGTTYLLFAALLTSATLVIVKFRRYLTLNE